MNYNAISLITLYKKEVQRFVKIPLQTIAAPAGTSLLFLVIFSTAIGSVRVDYPLDDFKSFLFPGLIMMTIIQNAFMNNSSSILMSKVQGNIVDLLMPPLSNIEIISAFTLAGITRGLLVAVSCGLVMLPFVNVSFFSIGIIITFAVLASAIMSLVGFISGIWAEKWDHLGTVGNFVIVPLSFLSGTFYSIKVLPEKLQVASLFNPFFYMIDGFRYGFLGSSDASIYVALNVLLFTCIILTLVSYLMLQTGYKLRA
tara:strand:- start:388 stop:1155 length:768 start_codon:yes stop_codon:yes gene_type:complete